MNEISNQVSQRKETDRRRYLQSAGNLLETVCQRKFTGEGDIRVSDDMEAVDLVLKNLTVLRPITRGFETIEEYISYQTNPVGIMKRPVELTGRWYLNALGCMLGIRKEDGALVALLPDMFGQYSYFDPQLRKKIKITAGNVDQFSTEALLFYPALPPVSLTARDYRNFSIRLIGTKAFFAMAFLTLACTLISALIPVSLYRLFGDVLSSGSADMILSLAIFLIGVLIDLFLFRFLRTLALDGYTMKVGCGTEAAVFSRVLLLNTDFHRHYNAGTLSGMIQALKTYAENTSDLILNSLVAGLFSVVFLVEIAYFTPGLFVPLLFFFGIFLLFVFLLLRLNQKKTREKYRADQQENSISYSMIQGIEKIRATGSEIRMYSRWSNAYAKKNNTLYASSMPLKVGEALTALFYGIGLLYFYGLTLKSGTTLAGYLVFSSAFTLFAASVKTMTDSLLSIYETIPRMEDAEPILKAVPEVGGKRKPVTGLSGEIQMQDVTYQYDESTAGVFDHLNLHIHPGEHVSIIGSSGSGKSTLVDLLLGYAAPKSGVVLYDGDNLENLDLRSLRQQIGTVLQYDQLIPGTIRDNIKLSDPWMDDDCIQEALRTVGLEAYVSKLPLGLDTIILEGNERLSGGTRQKLLLARAIAAKPDILILDESSSGIDYQTLKDLHAAITRLGCTCITISNTLSSVRSSDRVLFLSEGRILDTGTCDELMKRCSAFREMISAMS